MKLEVQTNDLHKHKDNWRKLKKELVSQSVNQADGQTDDSVPPSFPPSRLRFVCVCVRVCVCQDEMESLSKIEGRLKQARVDAVWARYNERKQQVDAFSAKVADSERKLLAAEAELAQLEQQYKDKSSEVRTSAIQPGTQ